jgi:hypothetical protein
MKLLLFMLIGIVIIVLIKLRKQVEEKYKSVIVKVIWEIDDEDEHGNVIDEDGWASATIEIPAEVMEDFNMTDKDPAVITDYLSDTYGRLVKSWSF